MTNELCALCALNGEVLFGYKEYEHKDGLDWKSIYDLSAKQSVLTTVAYAVKGNTDGALQKEWISAAYKIERNNYFVQSGNFLIDSLLTSNNIPYVILKGIASARYYKEDCFRMQGDVDFLVPPERAEEAKRLLIENGFEEVFSLDYETGYEKDGVVYELHTEVNGIPDGEKGSIIRGCFGDIMQTAVRLQKDGGSVLVPDDFHHGLILLLHTAKHLVGFGASLRQLSDWACFVNEIGERFPELFDRSLDECGLLRFAYALTAACVKYLNMNPEPLAWAGGFDDDFSERFIDDLIKKGGIRRDENDGMDTLLIEKTDRGGVSDSPMLFQLVGNLSKKAQFRWRFMKKIKILIPFGIIVMCVQYLFGMMTGKYKKINPKDLIANAEKRKKLYKELKLFE